MCTPALSKHFSSMIVNMICTFLSFKKFSISPYRVEPQCHKEECQEPLHIQNSVFSLLKIVTCPRLAHVFSLGQQSFRPDKWHQ